MKFIDSNTLSEKALENYLKASKEGDSVFLPFAQKGDKVCLFHSEIIEVEGYYACCAVHNKKLLTDFVIPFDEKKVYPLQRVVLQYCFVR